MEPPATPTLEECIGRMLLFAVTWYDENGVELGQAERHGPIVTADRQQGIAFLDSETNTPYTIPPCFWALFPAPPGEYREQSTGKTIPNPDFITVWELTRIPGSDSYKWDPIRQDWCAEAWKEIDERDEKDGKR